MTRLLNGLSAQLLLVTILPLALIVVGVAFGGVYAHREAMRMLVSERDMRAVMASANMLEHSVTLRADNSPDISSDGFYHLINPMADQRPMTAFLFDDAGIALLHTNRALVGANVLTHGGVREALRGDHGVTYLTDGASIVEHVVSYTPIQLGGRRFGLVMEEPWQDMVSPLMTYSQITPMVVMPLLLLIAIGLLLGMRRIVRPLRQLRLQARLAAAGDLTALAQPVNGIEEIEELQHTLKSLASQVTRDQDRQRGYARALRDAQETERKRLAHELHDDTIQGLIALNQRLQMASISARRTNTTDPGLLDDLRGQVLRMIEDVRQFSRALRPIYLEEAGLCSALERLASEAHEAGRVASPEYKVAFQGDAAIGRQTSDIELTIYRIAQEALNNAIKHARASRIDIELSARGTTLMLTVRDNGHGYDVHTMQPGMGLTGMRERAQSIDAPLELQSTPGSGASVRLSVMI